jgi:hypothetical protein
VKAFVTEWGSTAQERSLVYPCDPLLPAPTITLYRAVSVEASADVTFRWLCQLRAAPHSYDRIDNRGRRSPQQLTPGLEQLEVGQRFVGVFVLVAFELGRSLTLWHRSHRFGRLASTYAVERKDAEGSRIVLKILSDVPAPMRWLLAPGDLVMARRQLLNLKALAERG